MIPHLRIWVWHSHGIREITAISPSAPVNILQEEIVLPSQQEFHFGQEHEWIIHWLLMDY